MTAIGLGAPRNVAVIGGGISGMGAAYGLAPWHRVTVFEADARLGGHACTVMGGKRGDQPVDVGFIVFNRVNYPRLTELFETLDVPIAPSSMTFGVSIDGGRVEYALKDFDALFAQRRNLARPRYWGMLRDVMRFNAGAARYANDDRLTVADLLEDLGTSAWFRDYYLLPFTGAIWSTPTSEVLRFPAAAMVRFFQNHHLLDIRGQHQWYTVQGGSIAYVTRLTEELRQRQVDIRTKAAVTAVKRVSGGVQIKTEGGEWESFDEVVFAAHSDDAMGLICDPTPQEQASVGAIQYQPNEVVLHSDAALMPLRKRAWASWVYTEGKAQRSDRIGLTYWMNSLQPIPMDDPLFVTLNSTRKIDPSRIHHQTTFRHPVYDTNALRAQRQVQSINGQNHTWFCGAWMRNGFHEDGLASGLDIAALLAARHSSLAAA